MNHKEYKTLIGALSKRLKERKMTMCTAESCTGGLIAAMCTSQAGSSEWFNGGVVSYTNSMKERVLGVSAKNLADYGAVSLPVAEQMAKGALKLCQAEAAIAVSGIAGPGGGSAEKPVGTVCLAVVLRGSDQHIITNSWQELFSGNRAEVREATAVSGLKKLLEMLE